MTYWQAIAVANLFIFGTFATNERDAQVWGLFSASLFLGVAVVRWIGAMAEYERKNKETA